MGDVPRKIRSKLETARAEPAAATAVAVPAASRPLNDAERAKLAKLTEQIANLPEQEAPRAPSTPPGEANVAPGLRSTPPVGKSTPPGEPSISPARSSSRVLVIDDSEIARSLMCEALSSAGYEVFELPSAIGSTREVLRRGIGIVVIDLNMPAMRGDSLARLFRANPRMSDVRVILVSGSPPAEIESIARGVLADGWVAKSNLPEGLIDAVSAAGGATP